MAEATGQGRCSMCEAAPAHMGVRSGSAFPGSRPPLGARPPDGGGLIRSFSVEEISSANLLPGQSTVAAGVCCRFDDVCVACELLESADEP